MKIEIDLTPDEVEKLEDMMDSYRDEGPVEAGWQSKVLSALSSKVFGATSNAKIRRNNSKEVQTATS